MARTAPSLLEHALLGLVSQQPRSGYALRKVFATTPMAHYSDSPGTIYPALRRLQQRGWISGAVQNVGSLRPQRVFTVTSRGVEQLRRWLSSPVTVDDVMWEMDDLMLRFAFMDGVVGASGALSFLRDLRRALAEHVRALTRFHADASAGIPISGRLALESGLEMFKAQLRWATRAIGRLEEHVRDAGATSRGRRRGDGERTVHDGKRRR